MRLGDDTFVTGGERRRQERFGGLEVTGDQLPDAVCGRDDRVELLEPFGRRGVEQIDSVKTQQVEQVDRELCLPVRLSGSAADARCRLLKRMRTATGIEREHLTVGDKLARRQRGDRGHDLRHPGGDIVESAGEQADVRPRLVYLDACSVELVLPEDGRAQPRERVVDAGGRLREHRPDRAADLQLDGRKPRLTGTERERGGGGEVAGEHRGPPHRRRRNFGCSGDRIGS